MSSMNPQATGESTQSEKPQETKAPSSKMPKRVVRITAALCAISLIWVVVTLVQALLAYQKVSSLSSETSDLQSQSASIEQQLTETQHKAATTRVQPWCDSVTPASASDAGKIQDLLKQLKTVDPKGEYAEQVCPNKVKAFTINEDYSKLQASLEDISVKCEADGNHVRISGELKKYKGPKDATNSMKKSNLTLTITSSLEGTTDTATTQAKIEGINPGDSKQFKAEADLPAKALTCRVSAVSWWPADLK